MVHISRERWHFILKPVIRIGTCKNNAVSKQAAYCRWIGIKPWLNHWSIIINTTHTFSDIIISSLLHNIIIAVDCIAFATKLLKLPTCGVKIQFTWNNNWLQVTVHLMKCMMCWSWSLQYYKDSWTINLLQTTQHSSSTGTRKSTSVHLRLLLLFFIFSVVFK